MSLSLCERHVQPHETQQLHRRRLCFSFSLFWVDFFCFFSFFSFLGGWLRCSSSRGALVCWMVDVRLKPRGVGTASDRGGRQNGGREGGRGGGGGGGVQDGRKRSRSGADMGWLRIVSAPIRLCLHLRLSLYLCHCLVFCLISSRLFSVSSAVFTSSSSGSFCLSRSFNFLFIPLCL